MVEHRVAIRPPTRVFQTESVYPSQQRSFAYSQEMRDLAITMRIEGMDGNDNENIAYLRETGQYPSEATVNRWMHLQNKFGHARPFCRTGNNRAVREIKGRDLLLLSLYRVALPKASIAEVNAFLFAMNQDDPDNRLHSYSQICRAEASLLITNKRSSTTAFQAMQPINVARRHNFWNLPYPHGSVGIDPRDMIDIDEAGVYPNEKNRSYGKSMVGERSREIGTYARDQKLNILLAISGEDGDDGGDRWYELWDNEGTTIQRFREFIRRILDDIGPGTPERRRCFTMDNLNAHLNPVITTLILEAGHRILFQAPYYPVDGPIEYVFNTLQCMLCIYMREITDMESLRLKVEQLIGAFPHFWTYFQHVGFPYDDDDNNNN